MIDLLITDVTEMSSNNYCVAGWDAQNNRMVRPLPNGGNWSAALLNQHGIVAGTRIQLTCRGAANGIFPHRTEDRAVDPASIQVMKETFHDWLGLDAPEVAQDLDSGFGGNLCFNKDWRGVKQGVHILPQMKCRSLVAVQISKGSLSFSQVVSTLKATVNDGAVSYQLTVSSKVLKEAWRAGGLLAVTSALPARNRFHIRIGLARPFENPPKCYAMLNGVL